MSKKTRVGGGVTTIYAGTGCAIFWGAFFRAENKFWGITFGKITSSHKFWGVILEKYLFRVLILINFHLVKILDGCHNFRVYIFNGL